MMILVSGATRTIRRYKSHRALGQLHVPDQHSWQDITAMWAADNGAFSGFHPTRFLKMLDKLAGRPGCLFVTCPDVVGDARRTIDLFYEWQPKIAERCFPVAFVLQNGQEMLQSPPLHLWQVGFVGGTKVGAVDWKMSKYADKLICECQIHNKWVHVGRVNSHKRLRWFFDRGVDSVDGSSMSKFPDTWIPRYLRRIDHLKSQKVLY